MAISPCGRGRHTTIHHLLKMSVPEHHSSRGYKASTDDREQIKQQKRKHSKVKDYGKRSRTRSRSPVRKSRSSSTSSHTASSSESSTDEERRRKLSKKHKRKTKKSKHKMASHKEKGPVQLSKYMDERQRSAVSGKVIKMKVKKSSKDKQREKNRKQLLAFLNASTD